MWLNLKSNTTNLITKWSIKHDENMETLDEFKQRWKSIKIVYFTLFLMSLSISGILIGSWPFLTRVNFTYFFFYILHESHLMLVLNILS